jgi:hypothetical protein
MKPVIILTIFLAISLVANVILYFSTTVQSDSLSLIPRLKNDLKTLSVLLPENSTKDVINITFTNNGYTIKPSGEYYYAPKPNSTFAVNNVLFVFDTSNKLIQIYSSGDALIPIYDKP